MPLGSFGQLPSSDVSTAELADMVGRLIKEVNYLLNGGLDTLNVNELSADVINAGILNAALVIIKAINGSYSYTFDSTGIRANNGVVDTLKFDLATGLLTIVSALIQSATGYPKVELNSASNLFAAYLDANNAVRVTPSKSAGTPAVEFYSGAAVVGFIQDLSPILAFLTQTGGRDIQIGSGNKLYLTANAGIEMSGTSLKMNNTTAYSGSFSYVKNVVSGAPTFGTITVTNGIITSVT